MIIPIKCFTCGKVIGDKYRYYLSEVKKMKIDLLNSEDNQKMLKEPSAKTQIERKIVVELIYEYASRLQTIFE